MGYLDIMSDAGYGRYNRKLARITNLNCAVYWSEILDIIGHVIKRNTFVDEGYFTVDRDYITSRTGLDLKTQYECDAVLSKLQAIVLHPTDQNTIGINCAAMFATITESDATVLKNITTAAKVTRADKAEGKRVGIISRLKSGVVEPDVDLLQAYHSWIEVAYDKGICRAAQVETFKKTIEEYTSDKAAKLWIINNCIVNSYRDASWGINHYEKEHGKKTAVRLGDQKIASETTIDSNVKF